MDIYIFNLINQFAGQWPILDNLAIFFSDKFGYVLIVFLFIIFRKKWRIIIQTFAAAIISRLVITNIIRWIFPRLRPLGDAVNSFPSGHAAFYFAIAAVVYFYNKKLGILFFIASFLMGLARVFSSVHWPSDIIGGALVGIISAWLVIKFSKRFLK